jgi:hypothetical protein
MMKYLSLIGSAPPGLSAPGGELSVNASMINCLRRGNRSSHFFLVFSGLLPEFLSDGLRHLFVGQNSMVNCACPWDMERRMVE